MSVRKLEKKCLLVICSKCLLVNSHKIKVKNLETSYLYIISKQIK